MPFNDDTAMKLAQWAGQMDKASNAGERAGEDRNVRAEVDASGVGAADVGRGAIHPKAANFYAPGDAALNAVRKARGQAATDAEYRRQGFSGSDENSPAVNNLIRRNERAKDMAARPAKTLPPPMRNAGERTSNNREVAAEIDSTGVGAVDVARGALHPKVQNFYASGDKAIYDVRKAGQSSVNMTPAESARFQEANQHYQDSHMTGPTQTPGDAGNGNHNRGTQNEQNLKAIIANKQARSAANAATQQSGPDDGTQ